MVPSLIKEKHGIERGYLGLVTLILYIFWESALITEKDIYYNTYLLNKK